MSKATSSEMITLAVLLWLRITNSTLPILIGRHRQKQVVLV